MNSRILKQVIALTLAAAASVGAPAAVAQTEPAATGLEEIVVTARKREEVLMEVPVAISVLTAEDLEKKGVLNLQDVAMFTPGLSYFDAIQNQLGTPVVRGISQTNLNSPDRNVAIFYGGVYLANSNASNLEMLDIARVEVVKGPQSALYGRNAFMGAINFVPAEPTQEFYGKGEITMGSDERLDTRMKVAGPLTDTLGGRFAISRNTFDGTWENIGAPNDNLGGYETTNVSGMLQWDPSDELSGRLFGFWTDDRRDSSPQYYVPLTCGPFPPAKTVVCGDLPVQTEIGAEPEALAFTRKVTLFSLDASYDFGPVSLSGQAAYYKAKMDNYSDYQTGAHTGAGSVFSIVNASAPTTVLRQQAVPYMTGSGRGDSESWSAELRLESDQNQRLRWLVGTFYFENEAVTTSRFVFDGRSLAQGEYPLDAFGLGRTITRYTDPRHNMALLGNDLRNDEQLAFFGTMDFDFTDSVTGGIELRHDQEDRARQNLLTPTVAPQSDSFSYTTWRANVDWQISDAHMIYASAAKGVISGFFNPTYDAAAQRPIPEEYWAYDPAENITYEMGWKANWMDGRLTTELTAFYIDYTDIQISASIPPDQGTFFTNVIQNIGDATGQGFEFAVNWSINDNWTTGLTYSYAPTEFGDGTIDPGMSRYCGGNAGLVAGFCPSTTFNGRLQPLVEGEPLPRSPDTLASGYLSFGTEIGGGWDLSARADVSYTGEVPQYSLPFAYWASRTLVNARIGVSRGPLDIALWARNLGDEEYVSAAINQPGNTVPLIFSPNASLGERRTYGLTVGYSFGGK